MSDKQLLDKINFIAQEANKRGKKSALFVTNFLVDGEAARLNSVKENLAFVYGYCEVGDIAFAGELLSSVAVDYLFLHVELYEFLKPKIASAMLFNDRRCWADSVMSLTNSLMSRHRVEKILVAGDSWLSARLLPELLDFHVDLSVYFKRENKDNAINLDDRVRLLHDLDEDGEHPYDMIITASVKSKILEDNHAELFNYPLIAIDAGIGGFSENFLINLHKNKSEIFRIDNRAALSSFLFSELEHIDLINNIKGEFYYQGIRAVAGGEIGLRGDIIVDNISDPRFVIGVADGEGKTIYAPYEKSVQEKIKTIESFIRR